MASLFDTLTQAVSGQFFIAFLAAFLWGSLSILLSPCHLTSVPLVIGYISKENETSGRRSAALALTFAIGLLITIALIGVITASMGRLLGDVGLWGLLLVAGLLIVFGLYLMDLIQLNWLWASAPKIKRAGHGGALLLGLVFGIGLGPCTFAFLAPILAVALPMAQVSFLRAFALIAAFGIGHSLVFVLGGSLAGLFNTYVRWSGNSRGPILTKRFAGALVFLGGLYSAYTAF